MWVGLSGIVARKRDEGDILILVQDFIHVCSNACVAGFYITVILYHHIIVKSDCLLVHLFLLSNQSLDMSALINFKN